MRVVIGLFTYSTLNGSNACMQGNHSAIALLIAAVCHSYCYDPVKTLWIIEARPSNHAVIQAIRLYSQEETKHYM